MASPEAIFEREAVRSYMVADLWVALGHDITDPRIAGQGVDLIRLWADLMAEVRSLRPADEPDHECDFPPGVTDSEQRYYVCPVCGTHWVVCPVCGTHWVKVKRMIGREMYRSWHRTALCRAARSEALGHTNEERRRESGRVARQARRLRSREARVDGVSPHPGSHGRAAYANHHCRCPTCVADHREAQLEHRYRRYASRVLIDDRLVAVAASEHGSRATYSNWGCRCDACTQAEADHTRARRKRRRQ